MNAEQQFRQIYLKLGIQDKTPSFQSKYIEDSRIIRLELGFLNISSLPDGIFDQLKDLQVLYLQYNQLSSLSSTLFYNLENLQELYLFGNNISKLSSDIFDRLKNLKKLMLDYNNLSELPGGIFDELINLRVLRLNNNQLSDIPLDIFDNLSKLEKLFLSENSDLLSLGLDVKLTNRNEVKKFINERKLIVKEALEAREAEKQRITALVTNIHKIIQQITPDIQVQLTRIAELSQGSKDEVENFLKIILAENPEYGQFLEFEQVFIRKEIKLTDEIITSSVSNITTSTFGKGDSLQICPNCNETQSTLIRDCTNCKKPLSFCNLCKRGFTTNDSQLSCPQCKNGFHRSHLYAYIQSNGECPVCKDKLTMSQYD